MTRVLTSAVYLMLTLAFTGCTTPAAPVRESYVRSAAGSRLFVRTIGTGPDTVIVLHGGPGLHAGYLVEPLTHLAAGHTFILFDQRGRGLSDTIPSGDSLTIHDDVDDLEALRAEFKLSRFAIVAHHYGALVAVDYTVAHPDRIRRLALVGPMIPRALYRYDLAFRSADTGATGRFVHALKIDQPDSDPGAFCRDHWGFFLGSERETDPQVVSALAPVMCAPTNLPKARVDAVNSQITTALGAWDYREQIGRLTVPVLVVMGDRNRIQQHAARTWAHRAPQGRLLLLPAAPQFPWVAASSRFTKAMSAFLAGHWPDGATRPNKAEVASPDDSATVVSAADSASRRPDTNRGR